MRIDHTRIAIRERSWLDNLDLALHVIRAQLGGVTLAALIGVVPLAVLNYAVLRFLLADSFPEDQAIFGVLLGTLLVMVEAPLATAPLTLYLGQAMFEERPDRKQIARQAVAALPQLLFYQVIVRAFLIVPVLTWIVPYVLWPYLNEVILLERNPMVGRKGQLSTMRRSSLLHHGGTNYLARALAAGLIALGLILALWTTQFMAFDWLLGLQAGWRGQMLAWQGVLWAVAVYFTVARFLNYLDQRIRTEGWEVELTLRAERQRLLRHAA